MSNGSTIQLRVTSDGGESVEISRVAADRSQLVTTPLLGDEPIHAGDIIETRPLSDGTHQLVRVVMRAPLRHYAWLVPQGWSESADRAAYLAKVEAAGGLWEQALGGLLRVHLPLESSFDAEAELMAKSPKRGRILAPKSPATER